MDEDAPEQRMEVDIDGETLEIDASSFPYEPVDDDEFTPEMQARLGASRELNELRERFGQYHLNEERTTNERELYEGGLEVVEEYGKLADAGAIVRDEDGRVLLIRHPEAEGWGHPGGMYEGEESLVDTAEREVREETGIECSVTGFCYVREKTIVREVDAESLFDENEDIDPESYVPPSYPMITVIFTAEGSGEAVASDGDEVLDAQWFEEPPEDTNPFTAALLDQC